MADRPSIFAKELAELGRLGNVEVVDVRTPVEYGEVHASSSRNIPLNTLDPQAVISARDAAADKPIYLICGIRSRSGRTCQRFIDAGYGNVVNVAGGTRAWDEAGLPAVRGPKAISLEGQVRIAVGLLVLLGALLGYLVHSSSIGLSGIVGAGLVFAGITDSCGMGMMFANMPWIQCQVGSCSL